MTTRRDFLAATAIGLAAGGLAHATAAKRRALVVVGPSSHPPGTHEVAAGGRLLQHILEAVGLVVDRSEGWPDAKLRESADTVVFIGDHFPPMKFPEPATRLKELGTMMDRGAGLVCLHYATGLRAEDVAENGDHPLLRWAGGYFATKCKHHQSVAKVMTATIEPSKVQHPVLHGVKPFRLNDEPYYNNYFGPNGPAKNVTTLCTAQVPPAMPKEEIVAWAVDRVDGGRGASIVMPHFYRNWKDDHLRKLVLNAIAWTAKVDVPAKGFETELPDLASFKPEAVEPKPAKKTQP